VGVNTGINGAAGTGTRGTGTAGSVTGTGTANGNARGAIDCGRVTGAVPDPRCGAAGTSNGGAGGSAGGTIRR
jgi:hypothetical protein